MKEALRRPHILVVDDVEEDRLYLRAVLERAGHEITEAVDAEAGLQQARQMQPVLIIMDVKMPGISGLEATRRLKSDPLTARTPVIVVSAHAVDRRQARESRYDALLQKPILESELVAVVKRLLAEVGPPKDRD
jgi:two-component system cell cycle response regulator DivK